MKWDSWYTATETPQKFASTKLFLCCRLLKLKKEAYYRECPRPRQRETLLLQVPDDDFSENILSSGNNLQIETFTDYNRERRRTTKLCSSSKHCGVSSRLTAFRYFRMTPTGPHDSVRSQGSSQSTSSARALGYSHGHGASFASRTTQHKAIPTRVAPLESDFFLAFVCWMLSDASNAPMYRAKPCSCRRRQKRKREGTQSMEKSRSYSPTSTTAWLIAKEQLIIHAMEEE